MGLPFFYIEKLDAGSTEIVLSEETSKHMVQVLRMQVGEQLQLTDGKGNLVTVEIIDDNRKKCIVRILSVASIPAPVQKVAIAISLVKNASRFEWFLEKATEIGVSEIIPLLCTRTEKQHFRFERMKGILVSAMLQSQQSWLPQLWEPTKFNEAISNISYQQKFIAHCEDEKDKVQLAAQVLNNSATKLILIGPEGDFTNIEIEQASGHGFVPVALGETRLRTETAGIVAASILCSR